MSLFWFVVNQLNTLETMSASKKLITRAEWEKRLNDAKIRKEDMNKLVMNFLVTEGYVEAAEKFRMESGTEPDIDLATITDRMAVKMAVQCGNVEDAIEKVNDLNPEILDTNPQLFFHLQQQRLIELIRNGKVEEALEFAQEELAPRGEENPNFLEELERTIALLAFEDVSNCPVGDLLGISQRLKTASEVNAAILTSQSHEKVLPRTQFTPTDQVESILQDEIITFPSDGFHRYLMKWRNKPNTYATWISEEELQTLDPDLLEHYSHANTPVERSFKSGRIDEDLEVPYFKNTYHRRKN